MRRLSVLLDSSAEAALLKLLNDNPATISDLVNTALIALAQAPQPVLQQASPLWGRVLQGVKAKKLHNTVQEWCDAWGIKYTTLRALITRVEAGSTVVGTGGKNKWRDKQDGRLFKTHTAWVADCLEKDLGISLDKEG
jgi:hypothetical protein